jgi:ABC-type multidrug transport system fused ATPase/permease subunit
LLNKLLDDSDSEEREYYKKGLHHCEDPDQYYEPNDLGKVRRFYKVLLKKKVLSGGKNLKMAIKKMVLAIRVFLKKPELLLLDEDFKTIDKFRNLTIQDKLWSMNCTIISILSDLENVLKYDRVFILDRGTVVEEGDPRELIKDKKSKLY